MEYVWDFHIIIKYQKLIVSGLVFTVSFTLVTILIGLITGLLFGAMRLSRNFVLRWLSGLYVGFFRCTPLLVMLVWVYYALPVIVGFSIPPVPAGVGVLSLYVGAFYSEIFRGGIQSIDKGQWEAARALGLRPGHTLRLVILPQAIRHMLPPFINQSVIQWKNTSTVSVIAVPDLLYQGSVIAAETFRPLEVYTVIAIIYIGVLVPLTYFAQIFETRMRRNI